MYKIWVVKNWLESENKKQCMVVKQQEKVVGLKKKKRCDEQHF